MRALNQTREKKTLTSHEKGRGKKEQAKKRKRKNKNISNFLGQKKKPKVASHQSNKEPPPKNKQNNYLRKRIGEETSKIYRVFFSVVKKTNSFGNTKETILNEKSGKGKEA